MKPGKNTIKANDTRGELSTKFLLPELALDLIPCSHLGATGGWSVIDVSDHSMVLMRSGISVTLGAETFSLMSCNEAASSRLILLSS